MGPAADEPVSIDDALSGSLLHLESEVHYRTISPAATI